MGNMASGVASARCRLDFSDRSDRFAETKKLCANDNRRRSATRAVIESKESFEKRVDQLHSGGIVDMHFDLPMDLYEKRNRLGALVSHYLPEFEAGNIAVVGSALLVEDRYFPEMGLRVALYQVARLYAVDATTDRLAFCRMSAE